MQRLNGDVNDWMAVIRQFGTELAQGYRGGDIPLLVLMACQCVAVAAAQRELQGRLQFRNSHRVNVGKPNPNRYCMRTMRE